MTEAMFTKYRNYLLSLLDLADMKPMSAEEFVGHISYITKDLFGDARGRVYRPLTENEAKLFWLEASISKAIMSHPALRYLQKAKELSESLDAKLLETYPLIAILGTVKPLSLIGNVGIAISHDVLAEAIQSGFISGANEDMILGFGIENDNLCFTFYPVKVLESRLPNTTLFRYFRSQEELVTKDFDLEKWQPSPSQMNN